MARIRSIKPSIWHDEKFISLSRNARLLTLGMISHADDEGRLLATPAKLAGDVFPADNLSSATVGKWRDEVAATGLIIVYAVRGVDYAQFPNYGKHQRISHPQPSTLPSRNGSAPDRGMVPR